VLALTLADGFAALNRGDLATAGEACKQALEKDQAQVPAHFLVGLVALEGQAATGSAPSLQVSRKT
jgi:hypothetical protein